MKRNPSTALAMGMIMVLGLTAATNAAIITGETIESYSVAPDATHPYENMINDSGFDYPGFPNLHNETHGDAWFSVVPNNGNTPFPFTFTIDLEGNYDLSSMDVWNYNSDGQFTRGVENVTISVASAEGGVFTSLGDFTFALLANGDEYDGGHLKRLPQTFSLSASNVRLVQFEVTSNHGDTYRTGMAEVQFSGTAIPEPASFLLLLLSGFGLMFRRPRHR